MKTIGVKTMFNRRFISVAVSTVALCISVQSRAAGIPVIDAAAMANQLIQISHMVTQITTLNDQLQNMKQQLDSVTGSRGLGSFGVAGVIRNYLPSEFADLADSSSQLANQIQTYVGKNAVLTDDDLNLMSPESRSSILNLRNQVARQQAMASTAYSNASRTFDRLQALMNQINSTTDQKGIAELQARIQSENTMLQNEQIKLQQAAQSMTANQRVIELQQAEVRKRFFGNTKTKLKSLDSISIE